MAKANNNWGWIILGILAIIGVGIGTNEYKKRKTAEKERDKFKDDYLSLLQEFLRKQKELPKSVLEQLDNLRDNYSGTNKKIDLELTRIQELIVNGHNEIAIEKLTKIVENVLSKKFEKEGKTTERKKCKSLHAMLEKAKEFEWIGKSEFHFSLFLKEERNKEAHELGVEFEKNWQTVSFLGGIELIYKLS